MSRSRKRKPFKPRDGYDQYGMMRYDPEFHPNHRKPFTEDDLEYMCKYNEVDVRQTLAFALGRTEHTIRTKIIELKRSGLYDYYKTLGKHW